MIATLGFPVRAGLAHHRQGQSPRLMLVGLFFSNFLDLVIEYLKFLLFQDFLSGPDQNICTFVAFFNDTSPVIRACYYPSKLLWPRIKPIH